MGNDQGGSWVLRGLMDGGKRIWTVPIPKLPFRVGRRPGLDLTLPTPGVSSEHAEFYVLEDGLRLRDLESTNGTFVNRRRIADQGLRSGDVVHFADVEFRLEPAAAEPPSDQGTVSLGDLPLPEHFVQGTRELEELLRTRAVTNLYQPIVALPEGNVVGHEALGRGRHPHLPEDPVELLRIASSIGVAANLSRLFRKDTVQALHRIDTVKSLFLNTHPAEVSQTALIDSLVEMRELGPSMPLTVEVHEAAIVNSEDVREFRSRLGEMGIDLAYDDFGSGQARLLELAEVPPHYLKFDVRFVRGISEAPDSKLRLVRSLVSVARDLGVKTVAEGVETAAEARVCIELGFDMAQGYHYARPLPLERLSG